MAIGDKFKKAWKAFRGIETSGRSSSEFPKMLRNYQAAQFNRLNADWFAPDTSANTEVFQGLVTLRNRARELERNDPYIKKYLKMIENNVVGSGFRLTNRAKDDDGKMDDNANRIIEENWNIWKRKKFASANGRMSLQDMERLYARSIARDGEVIIRMIRGFENPWGFALQFIEPDLLDEDLNTTLKNGNRIIMGIEIDENERPVSYWFKDKRSSTLPNEVTPFNRQGWKQIDASEIIHAIDFERANQTRAVSPMSASMENVKMLNGYMGAELVAARIGACKMGWYTSQSGDGADFDDNEDEETFEGAWIDNAEPGIFGQLPKDHGFTSFDPQHPTTAFGPFVKAELRAMASGLDVSYNMLANDSEGVNFSSLRGFVIAERDGYIVRQNNLIEDFLNPVFTAWLFQSMLMGSVPLPVSKFLKFDKPHFQGKRWQWVDPKKDAEANNIMVKNGWKTDSQVTSEQGGDFFDNLEIQNMDNEAGAGIVLPLQERNIKPTENEDDDENDNGLKVVNN